ncbi:unnamed protein product, partial [Clonostachys rosea f. rosea IK726]
MAPAAVENMPNIETTSDNIDAVNILKATSAPKQSALYDASEIDEAKDKSTFRQFLDAEVRSETSTPPSTLSRPSPSASRSKLDTFINECDPDTQESQMAHLLQTSEAMRKDGKPRWMQLVGLIHDLGKLLFFHDAQGQWDIVGDTFPVGCAFNDRVIFGTKSFEKNEDANHPVYSTKFGIYSRGCGLDNIMLSWGHDEYLYHTVKDQSTIPAEGLAMIRYHSFYPWHRDAKGCPGL